MFAIKLSQLMRDKYAMSRMYSDHLDIVQEQVIKEIPFPKPDAPEVLVTCIRKASPTKPRVSYAPQSHVLTTHHVNLIVVMTFEIHMHALE